ncbi:MAG: class I SAM-dependent methyltransferase [Desulfobacterales bacterium]|nr:class I SAM-dependent methyltransferase [Desulfobacterales bacterium]
MKAHLVRLVPNSMKPALKKLYYFPLDLFDRLKNPNSMIPPRSMTFVGSGDFEKIGTEFKEYFIELANLQPNSRVLDVGCGIGRMAIPLTGYLSQEGEYFGFDIVIKGIEWCRNRISSKFSNFTFQHSDVYNKYYNPKGNVLARDFRFPSEDAYFDFVFLTSVFTHMLPMDLENYLSEISRTLKPGGKCLITFFILNDESQALLQSGLSTLAFSHEIEGCLTVNKKIPEDAVAYQEAFVLALFKKYGLEIDQPIHYGSWCGRDSFLTYQDLVIATKTG